MSIKHLLKEMKLPKEITLNSNDNELESVVSVEPFEKGFATTVGNMFRRVLLSSIHGYAVTAFRIAIGDTFITSEYEPIPGVVEDSLDIVERIKTIKFLIDKELNVTKKTLVLEFKGKGVCTVAQLETSEVTILNKDLVLFEATEDIDMVMELELELGRGYVPANITEKRIDESGTIPIDAIFSPIENVIFNVESIRFGHRSDYEKLLLTVKSDGTVLPRDAVAEAAKIIKEHMTIFINFDEQEVEILTSGESNVEEQQKLLKLSIDELELSSRSYNCLRAANIMNIESLVQLTEREMKELPNFGNKSMDEIKMKLADWDLSLGMVLE